ncbi:MAG: DNA recombination protein RmuC, partial [Neisseria sp.]|nr:DNA recombination protein RmuC [Neisseria sp.]
MDTFTLYLTAAAVGGLLFGMLLLYLFLGAHYRKTAATAQQAAQEAQAQLSAALSVAEEKNRFISAMQEKAEQELAALGGRFADLDAAFDEKCRELAAAETLNRRLPALEEELADSRRLAQDVQYESGELGRRYAAAQQQIDGLRRYEAETGRLKNELDTLREKLGESELRNERLHTQMSEERKAAAEKLALLDEAKNVLGDQFQNLANRILEEKAKRFGEQNRESLGALLNPLNEQISGFKTLIQNTYEKETKERLTLENEVKNLQTLNTQLHRDARALTDALIGTRNKTQGNWGEMVLESVLQNSGLQKGREYIVQTSGEREDDEGRSVRIQPDVIVNLPDNKQIVIDAKVSLTAYVRYTQAEDPAEARAALAAHMQSLRNHVSQLSSKRYETMEGLHSLDFVFMFVPVEPAYLLALQQDAELFQECFDKRIMLAGPSTLLASLRTVANLWRNEQQNQNALKIAEEGGKLYDKFVLFAETMNDLGGSLQQAQTRYDKAMKQLKEGSGNLVNRADKLHKLGVKAAKQLDKEWVKQAEEESLP